MKRVARADQSSLVPRRRYLKLLPYEEIRQKIIERLCASTGENQRINVEAALGKVCAETVRSLRDLPENAFSAMDGYALASASTEGTSLAKPLSFHLQRTLFPGSRRSPRLQRGQACYVATGAPLPRGADTVVRVEEARIEGATVTIVRPSSKWKNVSLRGEDFRRGQLLFAPGRIFNPSDIGLLMSSGRKRVWVFRTPAVGILSVGDELTTPGSPREGDAARIVNNYFNMVAGYLSEFGVNSRSIGISKDDPAEIASSVARHLDRYDMLIAIGGSSVGMKDRTIDALSSLRNSQIVFHGARIVPIRPSGLVTVSGKPVVVLPANAISLALSFFLIALPILNLLSGLTFDDRRAEVVAVNKDAFSNNRLIDALYLVRLDRDDGGCYSFRSLGWGSNMSLSLSRANGFIRLGPEKKVEKAEMFKVTLLGPKELLRTR